jgi:hypothetical protein
MENYGTQLHPLEKTLGRQGTIFEGVPWSAALSRITWNKHVVCCTWKFNWWNWNRCILSGGWDSSVRTATRYVLDGPGINPRGSLSWPEQVQTGHGAHPSSCTMGNGFLARGESSRGVALATHPPLAPSLLSFWGFMAHLRKICTFNTQSFSCRRSWVLEETLRFVLWPSPVVEISPVRIWQLGHSPLLVVPSPKTRCERRTEFVFCCELLRCLAEIRHSLSGNRTGVQRTVLGCVLHKDEDLWSQKK